MSKFIIINLMSLNMRFLNEIQYNDEPKKEDWILLKRSGNLPRLYYPRYFKTQLLDQERVVIGECDFSFLSNGNFNAVYAFSYKENYYCVLKIPIDVPEIPNIEDVANEAERSVKLWKEINRDIICPAFMCYIGDETSGYFKVWAVPYIYHQMRVKPSVDAICNFILDLYFRTGRILVDAISEGNIIQMENGTLICIDISFALRLQKEGDFNTEEDMEMSQVSLKFWSDKREVYLDYFETESEKSADKMTIVMLIKALLCLEVLNITSYEAREFLGKDKILELSDFLAEQYDNQCHAREIFMGARLKTLNLPSFVLERIEQYNKKLETFYDKGFAASLIVMFLTDPMHASIPTESSPVGGSATFQVFEQSPHAPQQTQVNNDSFTHNP